jgi:hypothetical protein
MLRMKNYLNLSLLLYPILGFAQTQIEFHPINTDIIRMAETATLPLNVKSSFFALAAKLEILDRYFRFVNYRNLEELIEYDTYLKIPGHEGIQVSRNILENKEISKLITSRIIKIFVGSTTGEDILNSNISKDIDTIYDDILDRLFKSVPYYKETAIELAKSVKVYAAPYDERALKAMKDALKNFFSDTVTPLEFTSYYGLNSALLRYLFSE